MAFIRLLIAASIALPAAMAAVCKYPGGECYELKMQICKGHDDFSLHGLWAEWENGCSGPDFDVSALSSIRDDLDANWFSCHGMTNEQFWQHEWDKHGTCTGLSQLDYFQTALDMLKQHGSECSGSDDCQICFNKDLKTEETCENGRASLPKNATMIV
eukprot:TRINITY_DN52788_c0_g1_i1.p1 TRINITY_DN52788_c0_g1~~TRINITY_DN52788_c0_g1_i1.p1  ORF type:complete len:158 (+),score=29.68 TRINITY_DN52788_c0_g1_i1:72-545(+)